MYMKTLSFEANEYNILHNKNTITLYNIKFEAENNIIDLKHYRLINVSICKNNDIKFKFIEMCNYCKNNYDKSLGYDNMIISLKTNTIKLYSVSYIGFEIKKNEKIKCYTQLSLNLEAHRFFQYLYAKYHNMNNLNIQARRNRL